MEENTQAFGLIHAKARIDSKKSLDYMAANLGVAKKTVINWEKGISQPTLYQSMQWFALLGYNPVPRYIEFLFPEQKNHINEDTEKRFDDLLRQIPPSAKEALVFLFYGEHGSSPNGVMQLVLEHLHSPLAARVLQAEIVNQSFKFTREMGKVNCPDNIMPQVDKLEMDIEFAKKAVLQSAEHYVHL